jgi:integrase/recombinase XerD|tara:strand:+ start:2953 stop:3600 length:648 start_codon:yes stop_codon:yes gene_type:complete
VNEKMSFQYGETEMSRKGKSGQSVVLNDREIKQLLQTITGRLDRHSRRDYLIVVLSYWCGLRSKELSSLKVRDVFDGESVVETLRLVSDYTKNNKHRDIPLTNKFVQQSILKFVVHRQETDRNFKLDEPLFKSQKGGSFSSNSMVHLIKRIYTDCGFEKCSSHSGRRKFATNLIENGVDIHCVKLLMGHSSIQTTSLYFHNNPERLKNVMSNMTM